MPKMFWIRVQTIVAWLLYLPICGPVIFTMQNILKIRVENLEQWRALYKALVKDKTPLMICSNHLTYIDSVILIDAFASHLWYWLHFNKQISNLPASNYKSNFFFRIICYCSRCIFIDRNGSPTHKMLVLDQARQLLREGVPMTIFPEGRRSKTGYFDDQKLAYGIGKIIEGLDECRVMCVYMRSDTQEKASSFPKKNSLFKLSYEMVTYRPKEWPAKDAAALITRDIARRIKDLEEKRLQRQPIVSSNVLEPELSPTV